MESRTSAYLNIHHPSNFMLSIISGTIGAIGIPGNFFLLCFILSRHKHRKPHEWLLFALAMNDFILCVNNATLEAPFIINFDTVQCKVAGALEYLFGMLSMITPPLVAYNRYLALYDNQKYTNVFTTKNIFLMWVLLCSAAISCVLPYVLTGSIGQDDLGLCGVQLKNSLLAIVAFVALAGVFFGYGCLMYFSYAVIRKVRKHKRQGMMSGQLRSRLIRESQDIITTMVIVSVIPLFSQLPAAGLKFAHIFIPPIDPWISRSITAPFPLASAVNAYVTVYVVRDYRKKIMMIFKNGVAPWNMASSDTARKERSHVAAQRGDGVSVRRVT